MGALDLDALRDELELVVMDVVAGGPNTDKLHRSIRRVIEARLRRLVGASIKDYAVEVASAPAAEGIEVIVRLRTRPRSQVIRLRTAPPIR